MFWRKRRSFSDAKLWALAAGGILTALNDEGFSTLRCRGGKKVSRDCLEEWWDVVDEPSLSSKFHWLWTKGHRADCREVCQLFRTGQHHSFHNDDPAFWRFLNSGIRNLEATYLIGWDLCRLINVARWGFTSGYCKESLAWAWIMRAAQRIQRSFESWADYGQDFLLGFDYWRLITSSTVNVDLNPFLDGLLRDRDSPWLRHAWNTDLSIE